MNRVGFIGCGTMGKPMALNLLKAGYELVVYDIDPMPVKELVASGATKARSSKEVAEQLEIIITMLPSSPHVEEVMFGPDGVLESLKVGSIIIDMSTINPIITRKVAAAAAEKGIQMLDAPVSGGVPKAIDGTLTIIVGGKKEIFEECKSILQIMGENIIHAGDIGMGEVVKLANQLLVGVSMIAVAESFLFGTRLGADPQTLYDVLTRSSGNSFILEKQVPYPNIAPTSAANRDFAPGFMTELMAKDLDLILSAAKALRMPLITCSLAYQMYEAAKAVGLGKKDFSVVSKIIQRLAGGEAERYPSRCSDGQNRASGIPPIVSDN